MVESLCTLTNISLLRVLFAFLKCVVKILEVGYCGCSENGRAVKGLLVWSGRSLQRKTHFDVVAWNVEIPMVPDQLQLSTAYYLEIFG